MPKCSLCKKKIEETFLGKLKGTLIKGKNVCAECQSKHKEKLIEQV